MRTCDIGGWTDTWFGGPGRVLNVAVSPGIEVVVRPAEGTASTAPDDRLVRAALERYPPPRAVEVGIQSGVPAGSALGTSAAVAVALLAALLELRGQRTEVHEVAAAAHLLETEVIGEESGVQDQLGAAYGGISYIRVDDYPNATVETLPRWEELGELMTVVYLGHPHVSSEVHREVIRSGDREVFGLLREAVAAGRSRCCIHQRSCETRSSSGWAGMDDGRCCR